MPVPVAVGTVRESGVTRIGFLSLSGLKIFKILETAKILALLELPWNPPYLV